MYAESGRLFLIELQRRNVLAVRDQGQAAALHLKAAVGQRAEGSSNGHMADAGSFSDTVHSEFPPD